MSWHVVPTFIRVFERFRTNGRHVPKPRIEVMPHVRGRDFREEQGSEGVLEQEGEDSPPCRREGHSRTRQGPKEFVLHDVDAAQARREGDGSDEQAHGAD